MSRQNNPLASDAAICLTDADLDGVAGGQALLLPAVQKVREAAAPIRDDSIPDTYSLSLNFEKG